MMMPVKNVSRGWWLSFGFALVLGGLSVAPDAMANPSPSATANCAPGRNCRARSFTATAGNGFIEFQLSQLAFMYLGSTCNLRANSTNLTLGGPCNWAFASTGGGAQFLAAGGLYFTTQTFTTSFTDPTTLTGASTLMADTTTARLWRSDGLGYQDVNSGEHPTIDAQVYWYAPDLGASGVPTWKATPRFGAADVAFTTVAGSSSTSGGVYTINTTAVSGNQAHHSTGAFATRNGVTSQGVGAPNLRWTARVQVSSAVGVTRVFAGMSSALPLAAGTDTPTASAAVFRYSPAGTGGNWFACLGQASALQCTDTGVAVSSSVTRLEIDCRDAAPACTFWIAGRARVRLSANIPVGNVAMGSTISVETKDASAKNVTFGAVAVSQ